MSKDYELICQIGLRRYYRNVLKKIEEPQLLTANCRRYEGLQKLSQAANCNILYELGVREAYLSRFLVEKCGGFVHGIDIVECPDARVLEKDYPNCYKFWKADSLLAHLLWPDEWADFIHLDSWHEYNHVKKELGFWWPKLRPGGIISGDDFMRYHCMQEGSFGVTDAVMEFVENFKLPLYVIGCTQTKLSDLSALSDDVGEQLKRKVHGMSHNFIEPPNWYIQKPF